MSFTSDFKKLIKDLQSDAQSNKEKIINILMDAANAAKIDNNGFYFARAIEQ